MGILRSLKRGIIIGGLVGALAGSQYGNVQEAYKDVLKTNVDQTEYTLDFVKDRKNQYSNRKDYNIAFEDARKEYEHAKNNLKSFNNLSEKEQTKKALTDVQNYGMTIKNLDVGLPSSIDNWKGAGKGAIGGAATGGVVLLALSARKAIKNRKKSKESLESKVAIFLGLLAGGVGLYLTSFNVLGKITGNAVGNIINIEGILGIFLLVLGIFCSYEYFKEN